MKATRKIFSIILSILFLPLFYGYAQNLDTIDIKLDDAVIREGLEKYLALIPEGKEERYGFNSREEFSEISYNKPICLVTLPADFTEIYERDRACPLQFGHIWLLPLKVKNEVKSLLYLKYLDNELSVIGIGGRTLSRTLDREESWHSSQNEKMGLLMIYEPEENFLVKNTISGNRFYPLGNTRERFCPENGNSYSEEGLLDKLHSLIKNYEK